jgi:flagellar hook-length control protein FliK
MEVGANGKTRVHITADNQQTLDLLQSDSKGLQKALADAGLKADSGSLSFNLRGGQGEGSGGNQGQNQAQAASNYRKSHIEDEPILPAIATVTRSYMVKMPDGLDINV